MPIEPALRLESGSDDLVGGLHHSDVFFHGVVLNQVVHIFMNHQMRPGPGVECVVFSLLFQKSTCEEKWNCIFVLDFTNTFSKIVPAKTASSMKPSSSSSIPTLSMVISINLYLDFSIL